MVRLPEFTDKIKNFMKVNAPPTADKKHMDPFLRLESHVARLELKNLVTKFEEYNKEISPQSLEPFVDLLAQRWRHIQKCDASYFHNENAYINRVYIYIAQLLGDYLHVEPYSLLMPGLKGLDPKRKLHEYILRGNPPEAMLVEDGFALLEKKYPPEEPDFDDEIVEFETGLEIDKEEQLLANHSALASQYYAALKWKFGDRDQLREEFLASLRSDNYQTNETNISFYSNKHLIAGVLARTARSRHDFVSVLKKLPTNQWKEFFSYISRENLFRFILQPENIKDTKELRDKFTALVKDKKLDEMPSYHPKYERALVVAYAMTFREMRDLEGEWTSAFAQTFGKYMSGLFGGAVAYVKDPPVSKQVKLMAIDLFIDYLLDENNPIGGFHLFLAKQLELEKKKGGGIYTTAAPAYKGGVMGSLIGPDGYATRLDSFYKSKEAVGMLRERAAVKSGIKLSI